MIFAGFFQAIKVFFLGLLVSVGLSAPMQNTPAVPSSSSTLTVQTQVQTQPANSDTSAFNPVATGITPPQMSRSGNFAAVAFGYYTDGTSIFGVKGGMVYSMPEADPATFRILTGSVFETNPYALDKNNVYFDAAVISGADPQTFHVINGGEYALDDHAAYWKGSAITGVDIATFSVSTTDFTQAQDKNHLYCGGVVYPLGSACATVIGGGNLATSSATINQSAQTSSGNPQISLFSASPTHAIAGTIPMSFTFYSDSSYCNTMNCNADYSVNFGDGSSSSPAPLFEGCNATRADGNCSIQIVTHTYASVGTYIAKLENASGSTVAQTVIVQ